MSGVNFKDTIEKRIPYLYLHFRRWRFFTCGGTKTCKVTCGGHMDVSEEQKLMLSLTLHEDCQYSGTVCIPDEGCQPVNGPSIENESFTLPVIDGYQILSEKNDPEHGIYVKMFYILHVIKVMDDHSAGKIFQMAGGVKNSHK
jgi:hypothetical protein